VSVSVFVMPLRTWLGGTFRTTWGGERRAAPDPRPRRSEEEADRLRDEFLSRLEPLLGDRPAWDEEGEARSGTVYSVHGFSLPFLLARRWSYRMKLPRLSVLEPPQLWIPPDFERVFRLGPPWSDDGGEVMVASLPRVRSDLDQLLDGLAAEEGAGDWTELRDAASVGASLRSLAVAGIEADVPVIVEG
jgi:hypothetical protein